MSFENDMKRIEEITERLRDRSTPLDDALKLFEEGAKLARKVDESLSKMERKVEILVGNPEEDASGVELEDFLSDGGNTE
ncbi:exodeoxyribonuclease VII small subunit [Parasphaerochaeta coccoides]|uniref:Exodeoxyribonuclease 7 small subunit n=1 Tax=Parasphaerochaeta coccoides (strain ATCC BAA-1237 / DSM 17374 / SPN1) TaxID=760011 RepID=F4GHB0_PARC1|nr:exodeoxyribonuclease VII small subunit [Parasphaerochaeta coccoides]AEC02009.1 Exodeoxyribonuclease 7 small subunit [Parasphaerochaeta coccoides DSM 17374]